MKTVLIIVLCAALAVQSLPTSRQAESCTSSKCQLENNCRCSSLVNPIGKNAPQLIAITVSESVVTTNYEMYIKPLLFNRYNPDERHIGATFFVNHEYTDYELVQKLWLQGFEIGSHSITKNYSQEYWRNASYQDLVEEFGGQKTILNTFAKIPEEDIIGVRTPQLQLEGDVSINAYVTSQFAYDNSWPTLNFQHYLPYTLDYKSTQSCLVTMTCPTNSHPGFWVVPITDIKGADNIECNSLATCNVEGEAEEIADWLIGEINNERLGNRSPLVLRLDSYWFQFTANSFEGFSLFLDRLATLEDVYLVSTKQVYDWTRNPKPLGEFQTEQYDRYPDCKPISCFLKNEAGAERIMRSCISCPAAYPWKGNPLGEVQ